MKFAIVLEQRDYLRKHGFIPFKELLKVSEIEALNAAIDQQSRTQDLWRLHEQVKRVVFSKRLVELSFDILQKKPLRIAFDKLIQASSPFTLKPNSLLIDPSSLQDLSSVSSLQGALLICLKTSSQAEIEPGDGYFLLPSTSLSLIKLSSGDRFLLIAYGDNHSQYLFEERDPDLHFLKSLGYVFGDKLNERLHPTLLR